MTRSSTKELLSPFENLKQKFCSKRRLFDTPSLVESNSPEFDHNFDIEEQSEEEVRETMTETMKQYMSKTRENYGSGVTRPTINQDTPFELKGKFLKELRDNTFSGSEHEDANEHIENVLEIVDLFHIPKVTQDQIMLRAFLVSLTRAASKWLRKQPSGSITTWEILKTKILNKYCPPARTAKKMEEINNFQQEADESLFCAWKRFKELLMKCPQHYLNDMQEVILFYNGLDVPTQQILDSKGAIPLKTAADAKIAIQEMAKYSQKWHNGTSSRTRSFKNLTYLNSLTGLALLFKPNQSTISITRNKESNMRKCSRYSGRMRTIARDPHYTKDCLQKGSTGKTFRTSSLYTVRCTLSFGGQY
ncbi:retrovirus-related pol polyprotein from transposon TNT 1-94 [Tanacetum coccineum]